MSDSEDSTVTYMAVSSPFGGMSDIGSPVVDGTPVMPEDPYAYMVAAFQAPPSPDYVPGPEEPEQTPLLLEFVPYVPEPAYPEFMPPEDEVLPAKEQPLPAALSPTADSPGYIPESYLEEDPEEDDDEDPEEDPTNYHADGGDNGDDEDESSDDDEDDDVDIKEDEEEEEEHLAPADSTIITLPTVDHAPSAKKTEPFETDESAGTPPPHPAYRVTARILIRDKPPTPFWSDTEVARLLAIPTPLPSPLSPWSSPLPQIPSPPLPPILSPLHLSSPPPASPTYPLGYRAAMIRREPRHRLLPIHHRHISYSPTLEQIHLHQGHHHSYPYRYLLHHHLCCYPLLTMKRTGPRFSYHLEKGYVLLLVLDLHGAPATDDTELGRRMTEFATRVRQDTDEIYVRLDDEQTERQLMAGQLNMLYRDRRACSYNSTDGERGYEGLERLGDDLWTLVILHGYRGRLLRDATIKRCHKIRISDSQMSEDVKLLMNDKTEEFFTTGNLDNKQLPTQMETRFGDMELPSVVRSLQCSDLSGDDPLTLYLDRWIEKAQQCRKTYVGCLHTFEAWWSKGRGSFGKNYPKDEKSSIKTSIATCCRPPKLHTRDRDGSLGFNLSGSSKDELAVFVSQTLAQFGLLGVNSLLGGGSGGPRKSRILRGSRKSLSPNGVREIDRISKFECHEVGEQKMGSRTGVVIGSGGPTGGWTGAVLCETRRVPLVLCLLGYWLHLLKTYGIGGGSPGPRSRSVLKGWNKPGGHNMICNPFEVGNWSLLGAGAGAGAELGLLVLVLCSDNIHRSGTSDETAWVEEFVLYFGNICLSSCFDETLDMLSELRIESPSTLGGCLGAIEHHMRSGLPLALR
ncbi:hypothetical protein Tco_1509575 [Tanacetum coccineum]